jgi:hypothetical protein
MSESESERLATRWSVKPHPFEFQLSGWRTHTQGCSTGGGLGCLSLILAMALGALALRQMESVKLMTRGEWWLFVGLMALLILVLASLASYSKRAHAHLQGEALAATKEARTRYVDIGVQAGGIVQSVEHARFYLDVAAREFQQHRFAPFWDAMENAAKFIGQCKLVQGYLAFDIDQYVNALSGRLHDFPTWDHAINEISNIEPELHRFAELKDAAEADYQFASMREFRETRQVMIAEFRTLGEALRHLERAVVSSISDLKRSVDRSMMLKAADPVNLLKVAKFLLTDTAHNRASSS